MSIRTQMTEKQTRFVREYLVDGNGSRAAVAAGYGVSGASVAACRTLANASVREAIRAGQASDINRLGVRRQDAIRGLLEAVEQAKEQGNPAAMISGWREIGRMLGFYEPERTYVKHAGPHALNSMSDAELTALLAAS